MHSDILDFDVSKLLPELHQALAGIDTVNLEQIKTYAIPLKNYIVGDDSRPDNMIHIQLRVKPGRTQELLASFPQTISDIACTWVEKQNVQSSVSVELCELDDPTYKSNYII